jgi:hypothetical protein
MRIYLSKIRIITHIPTSLLRYLELPTKSQLQAGYLSTTFLTSLALPSFLTEAKRTFTNFPMAHHNFGSSRATPSRLGGFTSKSNKCHKNCFTKLKFSQRGSHSTIAWFLINQPNLTKRYRGEVSKAYGCVFSFVEPSASKGGMRKAFILIPKKLAVEN